MYITAGESGDSGSGSMAVIAGGVAGGLIVVISFCIVLYLFCGHKRKKGMCVCTCSIIVYICECILLITALGLYINQCQ